MDDSQPQSEAGFPWLPGEGHRHVSPELILQDDAKPPPLLMLTLRMLVRGHEPQDDIPPEWLAGVGVDEINAPIRAFARECFGLLDIWNQQSQSYDWFDGSARDSGGSPTPISSDTALQRCWTSYAQLLLDDLKARGESAASALNRIPKEWDAWFSARRARLIARFTEEWCDAAAWPPALALYWILFGGDWERIAGAVDYGSDIPRDGLHLHLIGAFHRGGPGVVEPGAHKELMRRMRLRRDQPGRVIVQGLPNSHGSMVEIDPADLATLDWAEHPPMQQGAVLERRHGIHFSNVMVDTASLLAAFQRRVGVPTDGPRSGDDFVECIRSAAKTAIKPGMRASQKYEAVRTELKDQGLHPASDAKIKAALQGTGIIPSRPARRRKAD